MIEGAVWIDPEYLACCDEDAAQHAMVAALNEIKASVLPETVVRIWNQPLREDLEYSGKSLVFVRVIS